MRHRATGFRLQEAIAESRVRMQTGRSWRFSGHAPGAMPATKNLKPDDCSLKPNTKEKIRKPQPAIK
jgi:hypothetical protein